MLASEGKRPLEVTLTSILCWVLGGIGYFLVPVLTTILLRETSVEALSFAVLWGGMGLLLALAGVGLWRMEQWWMFPYGMFVGMRTAVRFAEVFTGSFTLDLVARVGFSLVWVTLGLRMMRVVKRAQTRQ